MVNGGIMGRMKEEREKIDDSTVADSSGSALVLVAVQPRAYSHAIAAVIEAMRPRLRVRVTEPDDLEDQVRRLDPDLVLCSQPNTFTPTGRPFWVEFYPYAESSDDEIRVNGKGSRQRAIELADLLALLDGALAPDAALHEG